jgi:hypothetical protein
MAITPVDLTDTFDVWRTRTNQIITLSESTNTAVSAAFTKANAANVLAFNTGIGANAFASATIAGANTAVGTGANAFTSATIAGANAAVGAGANAFTSATIAGANTAVGAGANAFTINATTGSNNYILSVIAGANTAVGTGANAFASATIAGANTAVGAGANTVGSAAFVKANSSNAAAGAAFDKANTGGTFTGDVTIQGKTDLQDRYSVVSTVDTPNTINCLVGNYFTRNVTVSETITFINPPPSGNVYALTIKLANAGSYTITWANSPKWPSGTAPTLSGGYGNTDILVFFTDDGGANWRGNLVQKDSR